MFRNRNELWGSLSKSVIKECNLIDEQMIINLIVFENQVTLSPDNTITILDIIIVTIRCATKNQTKIGRLGSFKENQKKVLVRVRFL